MLAINKQNHRIMGSQLNQSKEQRANKRTPLFQNEEKFGEYQIKKKVLTNEQKEKIREERASEEKKYATENSENLQTNQIQNSIQKRNRQYQQQNSQHHQQNRFNSQPNSRPQQNTQKNPQAPFFRSKPKPSHKYYLKSELLNQFNENWLLKNTCLKFMPHVKNLKSQCHNQVIPVLPIALTDVISNKNNQAIMKSL